MTARASEGGTAPEKLVKIGNEEWAPIAFTKHKLQTEGCCRRLAGCAGRDSFLLALEFVTACSSDGPSTLGKGLRYGAKTDSVRERRQG
jgi:hypothetical protein